MPIADPIERAIKAKEYRSRPEVKARYNETARARYHNGGQRQKIEADAARRAIPEVAQKRVEYMRSRRTESWSKVKLGELKCRAKKLGLEFDIDENDLTLPDRCPIFGTKLECGVGKQTGNSPSVDRIDNAKGYVKGNVIVVSQRANSLKRDASLDELRRLVDFYKQFFIETKE